MNATVTSKAPASMGRLAAFLADKAWVRRVGGVARTRVHDRESARDVLQQACAEALAHADRLPDDDAAAKQYILGIVRNLARMHARERARDENRETLDENLHLGVPPAPIEERNLLRVIASRVPEERIPALSMFVRVTLGDSIAHVAKEDGVGYAAAQQRVNRMRKELQCYAKPFMTVTSILALAAGLLMGPSSIPGTAPPAPAQTVHVEPPSTARAAELRRVGLRECSDRRWKECVKDLDEAKALDGAGDKAPDVKAARMAAEDAWRRESAP